MHPAEATAQVACPRAGTAAATRTCGETAARASHGVLAARVLASRHSQAVVFNLGCALWAGHALFENLDRLLTGLNLSGPAMCRVGWLGTTKAVYCNPGARDARHQNGGRAAPAAGCIGRSDGMSGVLTLYLFCAPELAAGQKEGMAFGVRGLAWRASLD